MEKEKLKPGLKPTTPDSTSTTSSRDFMDKVARVALAIERAGGDSQGDSITIHKDFVAILELIPEEIRVGLGKKS